MAAEVSRKIKNDAESGLVTRDFLGGCSFIESKELDLDLDVPSGWEKRLDLKSGNVYIQRHIPANAQSHEGSFANNVPSKLQYSNSFPKSPNVNALPSSYTSVCTLDKVRVALDRAERSSECWSRKRLAKEAGDEDETCRTLGSGQGQNELLVAAACPGCFLYVLISKNDPKCPNCNSAVQLPVMMMIKKPKIDLNL